MQGFIATEIEVVLLLIVVSLVAVVARYSRLPYTVALVIVGIVLTVQTMLQSIELTPDLVLALFLPPFVFEAAFHLQFRDLRDDLGPILALAVPGVVLSTALVGGLLYVLDVLPLPLALLFGALISATDPVSVVATFKSVGAPRRLSTLVEGESLFNDGTAIVLFHIALGLALVGHISPVEGITDFLIESVGGLAVGFIIGYLIAFFIARIDDYLIEITLTTVLAYGSYLFAQEILHVSGVLAVVMAGLISGNVGVRGMSPTTRIVLTNFWEYVAFLANSFVFLLIGLSIQLDQLLRYLPAVLASIAVVLVARVLTVYVLGALVKRFKRDLPASYFHVMIWGGLRGAVSLALALSLPFALGVAERSQLLAMSFGVVTFSLLVQAITIPALLRKLGLAEGKPFSAGYEHLQGELLAIRAARHRLDELYREGALVPNAWRTVEAELEEREQGVVKEIDALLATHPDLANTLVTLARREALRAQRAALSALAGEGLLSQEVINQLQAEVDEALLSTHDTPPQVEVNSDLSISMGREDA